MMYWDKKREGLYTYNMKADRRTALTEPHTSWSQSLVSIAEEQDPARPWLHRQAGINNPSLSQFDW